jgi:type I restriction enzyme S subunit
MLIYLRQISFIQTGDVRKADLYLTEFTQTYSEAGHKAIME